MWLELIVYLLRFYVFFIIPDLLATGDTHREKDSAVAIRRIYFERNFSGRVLHILLQRYPLSEKAS